MAVGDWTTGYHATPNGAVDLGSVLDDQLQNLKALIRERAKAELDWGTSSFEAGYADSGRANPGSARAFLQNASPTKLRRPDNSAYQSGGSPNLVAATDQGRLWIDSDSGELWYYSAAGAWTRVQATKSLLNLAITATSTDVSTIDTGGSTTTLGSWTTALSITAPATPDNYRVRISAQIPLKVTGGTDRYARVSMNQTSPSALPLLHQEAVLRQQISLSFRGMNWFNFYYTVGLSAGATFAMEFVAEVNTGTDVVWGSGAALLVGDGVVNIRPACQILLEPITI